MQIQIYLFCPARHKLINCKKVIAFRSIRIVEFQAVRISRRKLENSWKNSNLGKIS